MSVIFTITLTTSLCFSVFFLQLYGYYYLELDSITHQKVLYYLLISNESGFIQMERFTLFEKRHLLDVKRLIDLLHRIFIISTLLSAIMVIFSHHLFTLLLRRTLWLLLIFNITLLLLVISHFPYLFESLHPYFFIKNSWLFSKESQLILLFPLSYFQHFAVIYISIFSIFSGIGLGYTSYISHLQLTK